MVNSARAVIHLRIISRLDFLCEWIFSTTVQWYLPAGIPVQLWVNSKTKFRVVYTPPHTPPDDECDSTLEHTYANQRHEHPTPNVYSVMLRACALERRVRRGG